MGKKSLAQVLGLLLLFAATQIPLYAVRYPDIQDYVNHLARLHIALNLPNDSVLQRYYEFTPGLYPNLPLDTIGKLFMRAVGLELGMKLFISLCSLILVSGVWALGSFLGKKRAAFYVGTLLFVYSFVLYYGLLNYLFGVGFAFWLMTLWLWLEGKCREVLRIALFAVLATALYLCHLAALAIFFVVLTGFILSEHSRALESRLRTLASLVFVGLPALVVHVFFYDKSIPNVVAGEFDLLGFIGRKLVLIFRIVTANISLFPTISVPIGVLIMLLICAVWKRHLIQLDARIRYSWGALFICFLVLPAMGFGSAMLDARLLFPLALLAWAGTQWVSEGDYPSWPGAIIVCAVVASTVGHYYEWRVREPLQDELRIALQQIPRSSKLAVVILSESAGGPKHKISEHAAAWSVIDRSALLSSLWARPYQPFSVGIRSEWQTATGLARPDQPQRKPTPLRQLVGIFDYAVLFGTPEEIADYAPGASALFRRDGVALLSLTTLPAELVRQADLQ